MTCELLLYVGRCLNDGLGEGRFYPDRDDPYAKKRVYDGLRIIRTYLKAPFSQTLIVDSNDLVSTNDEAESLIGYARKHFPNVKEVIEPHNNMHGRIIFARKIVFENCCASDSQRIIDTMKKSGHKPRGYLRKEESIRKTYTVEPFITIHLRELEGQIDNYWRNALRFS